MSGDRPSVEGNPRNTLDLGCESPVLDASGEISESDVRLYSDGPSVSFSTANTMCRSSINSVLNRRSGFIS